MVYSRIRSSSNSKVCVIQEGDCNSERRKALRRPLQCMIPTTIQKSAGDFKNVFSGGRKNDATIPPTPPPPLIFSLSFELFAISTPRVRDSTGIPSCLFLSLTDVNSNFSGRMPKRSLTRAVTHTNLWISGRFIDPLRRIDAFPKCGLADRTVRFLSEG